MSGKEKNGAGAEEIPDFVPTRRELIQIVEYWVQEIIEMEFDQFITGCSDGSQARLDMLASHRINCIEKILGEDEVTKIAHELYEMFGQTVDKKHWDIFPNGDKEQRDAVQDEFQRLFDRIPLFIS